MGGKRYYCDYCDRTFKDGVGVRKKHLVSQQHLKNKELHYKYLRDPEIILAEERAKKPCSRFMSTGECHFDHSCRYSHYTPPMMQKLEGIVAARAAAKEKVLNPNQEEIFKKFFDDMVDPEQITEDDISKMWPLPPEFQNRPDLPPSMRPMTLKDFASSDFGEWGW